MSAPLQEDTQPAAVPDVQGAAIHPYFGLLVATIAVSFSAILIKESTAAPVVIAAYRLAITTVLLAPVLAGSRRRHLRTLTARQRSLMVGAGGLLALHFAFWTASLTYTSVASSVLFVSVHPAFGAIAGWILVHERLRPRAVLGIVLTLAGSLIIAWGDLRLGSRALQGDGLALLGALVFGGYLLIGRAVRPQLDNLSYSTPIYGIAACCLIILTFPTHQALLAVSGRDLLIFLALAVVSTLGGHLLYNWTLRYVPTALVSVSFLGEPVLAALLAWLLLAQTPPAGTLAGGLVVLCGIALTVQG